MNLIESLAIDWALFGEHAVIALLIGFGAWVHRAFHRHNECLEVTKNSSRENL